jgi:hypothetical protein
LSFFFVTGIFKDDVYRGLAVDQTFLVFHKRVVRITVQPAFARLCGSNNRVPGSVGMFAGVTIRRAIAAERDAASLTSAQMNPLRTDLYALFAFPSLRLFD